MQVTDDIFTFLLVVMIAVILSAILINILFDYFPLLILYVLLTLDYQ